jgi:rhamnose transport system ATP-binding protein
MRDGRHVLTKPIEELTTQSVIRAMVGRDMDALFPKLAVDPGRVVLKVDRLTSEGVFTDISFQVRSGEIVALAGLVGAGRTEVARAIFGIDRWDAGSVEIDGRSLPPGSPTAAMSAGIGLVPEDRRQQGLIMDFSIERNIALASLDGIQRVGLIPRGAERRFAKDWAMRLQLKYGKLTSPVWTLSGGNQQKAVLAKWLARQPKLLIVDEPTRGIDVGTKAEVHRLLSELASQGVAVLMISSELPEVLGMADRVVVLFEGQVMREFVRAEATEDAIMHAATGLVEDAV